MEVSMDLEMVTVLTISQIITMLDNIMSAHGDLSVYVDNCPSHAVVVLDDMEIAQREPNLRQPLKPERPRRVEIM